MIYGYIRQNHPELTEQARYLRVRGIVHAMRSIDLAGKSAWETYGGIYRENRKELLGHVGFILRCPFFGKKERRDDLVLATGMYRWMRKVYHGIR